MIVIADDDADSREIMRDAISIPQISVMEAATAEEALWITRDYVLDVAVVDVFMPGRGGIWLIDELRDRNPDIKIVSVSGGFGPMPSDKAVRAAEKVGANVTITKPFDVCAFQDAIVELLE